MIGSVNTPGVDRTEFDSVAQLAKEAKQAVEDAPSLVPATAKRNGYMTKEYAEKLDNLGGLSRQNSTQYAVGNIAFTAALPSFLVLQCTMPGTTAATEPDFTGAEEGGTVRDGSVVWTYRNLLSGGGVPVGFIMPYAGTGLAEGWLDCDGSAVSRTMYPDLFVAIGTTWGAGDGSTTFNLPNSEDLVLQGASATNPVGTYKTAGLPDIKGSSQNYAMPSNAAYTATGACIGTTNGTGLQIGTSGDVFGLGTYNFDAAQSNAIYGASDTVQPPAACVRFMIKYE